MWRRPSPHLAQFGFDIATESSASKRTELSVGRPRRHVLFHSLQQTDALSAYPPHSCLGSGQKKQGAISAF